MSTSRSRSFLANLLLLVSVGVLGAIYFSPVWWVSLTAPNYPEEAFPDGIRIHFQLNSVVSGCEKVENVEIVEEGEVMDCVHEMDTINHYVGMYPIASGGVIETAFSMFVLMMLGIMIVGFMCTRPNVRSGVMFVGFALLTAWMAQAWLSPGGLKYQNTDYLVGLSRSLDLEEVVDDEPLSPGQAMIERLKASLGEEYEEETVEVKADESSDKDRSIEQLRLAFENDQSFKPASERMEWDASGAQLLSWHYSKNLARYFNNPEEIAPMVKRMTLAAHAAFWAMIVSMIALIVLTRKTGNIFYWALALLPMLLPVLFIADFSAWLWWYGHNLNDMGAFTLKEFMPTVFGQGKVAQFTTHSYPHYGFGFMVIFSALLAVSAVIRRGQLRSED